MQITALAAGKLGTSASSGRKALTAEDLTYTFYYAKKDEAIGDKTADTATADELVTALKTLTTNTADKGKVTLTTTTGIGAPKAVTGLTPGGEYHYTVRVQETAAPANGSNTTKAKTNTSSAARATGTPPAPTFSGTAGANTHTGFTTGNIVAAPMSTAKKADGEAVNPDDVEYKLYYASSTDALTAAQVKETALTASQTADDKTGGVKDATVGSPVVVTDKAFTGTVYAVVEAIIRTDTSKTALSSVASYKVTGAAAAGTGTSPSISAKAGGDAPGGIQISLTDPEDWGTRDDGGTPVIKRDVTFWLFYREDTAGDKTKQNIIADIDDATVHTTDTAAPDETKGVIQIAYNATHPFVITGLKAGTQYSFFLRIIHPDSTVGTKANERTEYARDTAVVQGTSAPEGWYVSTLAAGFRQPRGIAAATDGTLYVADTGNHQIKKLTIDEDGKVTVDIIAGDGTAAYTDDATGTKAQFKKPYGIALATDALYVADRNNHRIRKIALSGNFPVSTIAGDGTFGYANNANGTSAQFSAPEGIAVAHDGNALYVVESATQSIRKIALSGNFPVSTVARKGSIQNPYGIAVDPKGTALYVVDTIATSIIKIALRDNATSTFATGFNNPRGIAAASDGTLYVADTGNHLIKRLTLKEDGRFEAPIIIAGSTQGNVDGTGTTAQFNGSIGIVAVSDTILYIADTVNNSIRKLEYKAKEAEGEKP